MPDLEPTVAGYRYMRILRRDTLGEVHHAIHEKTSQPVCLRVLQSPEEMDAVTWGSLRYRLVGTLLSLQQLSDIPEIEAIQGVGEVGDGIWVVTDYLDGITLEDRRQTAGPTAYADALALLNTVATTLDKLHERGFTHGWLSADRVLVTRENELRLLGVGLGLMPGCAPVKYAAPEREVNGPSRAADIFAFGILLRKVIGAEQITLPVKAVLDKLTAPDPENRYKHAREAIDDLEQGRIPIPSAPTITVGPNIPVLTANVTPEEEIVPTVLPKPGARLAEPIPPPVAPPLPISPATPAASFAPPSRSLGMVATPAGRGEAAVMPRVQQSSKEKVWMVVAVVVFLAALGGLYLLLTNQKPPATKPASGAKTSATR